MRSFLAETYLLEWGDGEIGATALAKIAKAAKRDGLDIPMNNTFANVGSESLNNCARDLNKVLEESGAFSHTSKVDGDVIHWCIPPTAIIRLICRRDITFKKHLCPSVETCEMFWRDLFSSPEGMELKRLHPHLRHKTVAELKTTIAIKVHEDSGPYTKVNGVNVISWSSMLGSGIDIETKHDVLIIAPSRNNAVPRLAAQLSSSSDSSVFDLQNSNTSTQNNTTTQQTQQSRNL